MLEKLSLPLRNTCLPAAKACGRVALLAAACLLFPNVQAQTISYFNDLPEIQMWTYPIASANGPGSVRDRGSMFVAYSQTQNGTPTFFQGTGSEPTRRGSILVAAISSAVSFGRCGRLSSCRYCVPGLTAKKSTAMAWQSSSCCWPTRKATSWPAMA